MGMTEAEKDEAFEKLSKLTDQIVYIVKEIAKEEDIVMGGIPSAVFNAYQDIVIEQTEICANSLGGDQALIFIGVQMRTITNFVQNMQKLEAQIETQSKKQYGSAGRKRS